MEIEIARQIGQAIRKQRTALGLTQSELAEKAHVDRSLIIRVESGEAKSLYPEKLLSVLHALGLKMLIESRAQTSAADLLRKPVKEIDPEHVAKGKAFVDKLFSEAKKERNRIAHGISDELLAARKPAKKSKPHQTK